MEEKKEKKEKSVWNNYTAEEKQELFQLNESYKVLLAPVIRGICCFISV